MTRLHTHPNFYIDTDYRVLFEDDALLVINKPAPLAVHPVGSYVELNIHSLVKKDPRWEGISMKMVHRLDAETSGVLVMAKTYEAARSLGKQFLAGTIEKEYEAVVFGTPNPSEGLIDFPLGHDESSGFQSVRTHDAENGEKAQTQFKVLKSGAEYSRVLLKPLTGRTHQLRVHMALIGHPIVGDKIYIDLKIFAKYVVEGLNDEMMERLKLKRLALHAGKITFTHPHTRELLSVSAPLPKILSDFVEFSGLS